MKLIHCSDIHLDSAMGRSLSAAKARERNAEICMTFDRMVQYAVSNQADAVLIAGDLFDTARVSAQTAAFVLDSIRRAEQIDFLYICGNHDEKGNSFGGAEDLPGNLKLFGSDWTSYRYGDTAITGIEPDRGDWDGMYDRLDLDPADTNIVLLHGQTASQPGEEMIALPKLRNKHIHYLALGHIHSYQTDRLDNDGIWCYSGCLEGRGFDECGEKGFVLLDVQPHRIVSEFIPFACRTLYEKDIDISGLTTVTQIRSAMEAAASGISPDSLVRFRLTGTFTPDTQKDLAFLQKSLESSFYCVRIKDDSRLKIEAETYEHDISLKGEFIRTVMASGLPQEEKDAIILCGIQALRGEEVSL